MPTLLKNLKLDELSLVTRGANQYAKAPIFKADTSEGDNMAEDIEKMTDDEKAEMAKMSDSMKKKMKEYMDKGMGYSKAKAMCNEDMKKSLEEENQKLRKGLLDAGYRITAEGIEKKAPAEYIEVEGESILKSDIPAPILKRLEEAEAERKESAVAKKAKETLPNFKEDVAKELMGLDLSESILEALIAADALFEAMTEEVGKADTQGDMGDPNEKLNALAKAYASEHDKTFAQAYASIVKTDEGKALIKKAYQKD